MKKIYVKPQTREFHGVLEPIMVELSLLVGCDCPECLGDVPIMGTDAKKHWTAWS